MKNNFVPDCSLTTPVLFLIFNRPGTTQKVFDAIKKAKPQQLFIAADGPREGKEGEKEKCEKVKKVIEQINWDCKVKTLFRDKNLGCMIAVSSAIDWFFENVEEGIILEDDCLPSQSFFWFCQELLKYYKNDTRIMMISGTNYLFGKKNLDESYYFSKYYAIWGWATWKRAWNKYDIKMNNWNEFKKNHQLDWIFIDRDIVKLYTDVFQKTYDNKKNCWGNQWAYSCIFNNGLAVVPYNNLISNIGIEGTHTDGKPSIFINMHREEIDINNIKHPIFVTPNILYDKVTYCNLFMCGNKLKYNIVKFMKWIKIYKYIRIIYRKLKSV